jgi:hypothetical protein
MRGAKRNDDTRNDDTIELEFSAEELLRLDIAASAEYTECPTNETVAPRKRVLRHSRWAAVLAAVAVAGTSSGITYLAAVREQPMRVAEAALPQTPATPMPEASPPPAVRLVNPFDATEIFEFPGGMSENDARDAMAEILLNRARGRLAASAGTARGSHEAARREMPWPEGFLHRVAAPAPRAGAGK